MGDVGTGAKISFASSMTATEYTTLGQVTSINGTDIARSTHDTSHLGTSIWWTKMPGDLIDPGGADVDVLVDGVQFTGSTAVQYIARITSEAETIIIWFPGTNTNYTSNMHVKAGGFVESYSWGVPLEELMTASLHIQFSGAPVWTKGV